LIPRSKILAARSDRRFSHIVCELVSLGYDIAGRARPHRPRGAEVHGSATGEAEEQAVSSLFALDSDTLSHKGGFDVAKDRSPKKEAKKPKKKK